MLVCCHQSGQQHGSGAVWRDLSLDGKSVHSKCCTENARSFLCFLLQESRLTYAITLAIKWPSKYS